MLTPMVYLSQDKGKELINMKDYKANIELEQVYKLIRLAADMEVDIDCFEGVLRDSYFIEDGKHFKFGRVKPRKHIIILEKYVNEWSSINEIILTDNTDKFNQLREEREILEKEEV